MIRKRVDGLVVLTSGPHQDFQQLLAEAPIPLVLVDREAAEVSADFVQVDHERGGYLAGHHLVQLGHRRIALIAGPQDLPVNVQRLAGFCRALAEAQVPFDPGFVSNAEFTSHGGYDAFRRLLASGRVPTAVFADNDLMALGVICAAEEAGLSVPQELSVVGFDDIALAAYTNPPLTTIRQPKREIGAVAAQLLIERLADPERPVQRRILEPEFCPRRTTAKAGYRPVEGERL
jgi:LacI family transcriptional regulator